MKSLIIFVGLLFTLLLPEAAFAASATLSLSPSTATFNTGCTYSIDIMLNTDNQDTDGTDAVIKYDQTRIGPTASPVTVGTLYPDYPAKDFQNGVISISGLESPGAVYNSKGTTAKFATINISIPQSAPVGATQLTFDFTKGSTTDSNVVQTGVVTDILGSVVNGSYTIASGTGCTPVVQTASASAKLPPGPGIGGDTFSTQSAAIQPANPPCNQSNKKNLGNCGDVTPTLAFTILGGLLVIFASGGLIILRK